MSKLITPSLFGGIDWFNNCPPSWKEKAYNDLFSMLSRIYTRPGDAAQRGINFEKLIYDVLKHDKKDKVNCSDNFKKMLDICSGGIFQVKTKKYITVDDIEYCLYGKIDVMFPNLLIDIKTTGNYKGKDSYLKSMQHKIYCYNERVENFRYIICIFENDKFVDIQQIEYETKDFRALENEIIKEIKNTMKFFEEHKILKELYLNKYCLY